MKKLILLTAALFVFGVGLSQPDLLGNWTLHYMVIDGETINVEQPHPSNPEYHPGIDFFEDSAGYQTNGFVHFNYFFDIEPPILIETDTFTVNSPAVTLGDCEPYCDLETQYLGVVLFGLTVGARTFAYEIINESNGNKTLIITTPEGNVAVHGNYILSNNSFEQANISLYPNPAKNSLNISSTFSESFKQYRILSMSGKVVLDKEVRSLQNIDISEINSGLYFLEITSVENQRYIQKFIKL